MRDFRGNLTRLSEIDFWNEIERCHLLVSRLNDEDMRNGLCGSYLRFCLAQENTRGRPAELIAVKSLFAAWSTLSIQGDRFQQIGFEFDGHWQERMDSANNHIFDRLVFMLNRDDVYDFDAAVAKIYVGVLRDKPFGFGIIHYSDAQE